MRVDDTSPLTELDDVSIAEYIETTKKGLEMNYTLISLGEIRAIERELLERAVCGDIVCEGAEMIYMRALCDMVRVIDGYLADNKEAGADV